MIGFEYTRIPSVHFDRRMSPDFYPIMDIRPIMASCCTSGRSLSLDTDLNSYIVDIHRQLSSLKFFPIESVSKCVPPPPPESIDTIKDEAHIHTAKVFLSIEKLNGLLTLPTRLDEHTPFTICMITLMTIAHLSACCYIFKEPRLTLEREKIRLSMGALKMLGDVWPAGRREYHCMAIIAREILCLEEEEVPPLTTTDVMVT